MLIKEKPVLRAASANKEAAENDVCGVQMLGSVRLIVQPGPCLLLGTLNILERLIEQALYI